MPASRDIDHLIVVMLREYGDIGEYIQVANTVQTRARTRYYKAAYYTSAQIVELLVYMIVLSSCDAHPELLENFKIQSEQKVHDLIGTQLGSPKKLHIAESFQRGATLEDVTKDFQQMIAFCKSQNLIDATMKKRLDRIREKRNDIHLFLRKSPVRTYTRAHIDQLADTTHKLSRVLISIN